jgi:VWFA-related protein
MTLKLSPTTRALAVFPRLICAASIFLALSVLICVPTFAQTGGPSAASVAESGTLPQVTMEPVTIDLIARDKKKHPILNLTPADFSVSDGGNPIQLSDLHLVTPQMGGSATVTIVFDRMTPESIKVTRPITARLLSMAPDRCSFAVLGVDGGLRLFQGFTQDRTVANAALNLALAGQTTSDLTEAETQLNSVAKTGALTSGANVSVEERAKASLLLSALEDSQRIVRDQHSGPALASLMALAKAQQNLAGRKIFIFFSEGIRANSSNRNLTQEVVETANRNGITIYTVDTNGVDTKSFDMLTMMYQPTGNLPVRTSPGVAGITVAPNLQRIETMQSTSQDAQSVTSLARENENSKESSLATLASGTGGFSISAGDKMNEPLKRLAGDIATYYEASYTPTLKQFDGQFHPIDIQALRQGITIRSRAGYFALAPEAAGAFVVRPFEVPLLKILGDSGLPTDVTFEQAVLNLGRDSTRTANELVIEIPISQLELHQDQQTSLYSAHLSILAQVKDKSGVVVQRFSQDIARNGALETVAAVRTSTITMQRHFTASPGDYVLETAVVDYLGKKSGALRTEFTVQGVADGPWLSDIALVRRSEPFSGSPDPFEPLQFDQARVVPNVSHRVASGTPRISLLYLIHHGVDSTGSDGRLDVNVQLNGVSVSHSTIAVSQHAAANDSLNMTSLDSSRLAPGNYQAILNYTQGEKSFSRSFGFTIEGTAPSGESVEADTADDSGEDHTDIPADLGAGDGHFAPITPGSGFHIPSSAHQAAVLSGAKERALSYINSLANFKCIEVTDRFVDRKGTGNWSRHDKIAELVTYENHEETRKVLEVNGDPGNTEVPEMRSARLEGEFGGVLQIVFDPKFNAEFHWKQTGTLDGAGVQVFSYQVAEANSKFTVTARPDLSKIVAFHGLVYIDDATRGVRRVTVEAEGIPSNFPVRASAFSIDFDYVAINNHDYLVPVRGELHMKLGKTERIEHRIEFRDYHRFGSEVRIVGVDQ